MHNESVRDRQPESAPETEPVKKSKLRRIGSAAATAGFFVIPVAATVGLSYVGYQQTKMGLETAKLNLEAAKIAKAASNVAQKA